MVKNKRYSRLKVPMPLEPIEGRLLQKAEKSKKKYVYMTVPLDEEMMKMDNLVISSMYTRETYHNETLQKMAGNRERIFDEKNYVTLKYLSGHLMVDVRSTDQ